MGMKKIHQVVLWGILVLGMLGCGQQSGQEYYLFVGTYTGEGSEGIYLYKFNSGDGSVDSLSETAGVENPSYLALSPDHSNVYAVNEVADDSEAAVSSFSFDKATGELQFLNKVSSQGGAPCYVSVNSTGKAVFVGNYVGGSLAVFPVEDNGSLRDAKTVIEHEGSSVNEARQNSPHVHCTYISPDNKHLFVADLGTDEVYQYNFSQKDTALATQESGVYKTTLGAGPRHITFHPGGEYAYLINELNGTVEAFSYFEGDLEPLQTISTLPEGYEGAISGADIHVSPDGNYLYASSREDLNNIVIYSIDRQTGKLTKVGKHSSGGVHPRNFTIDPTGQFLLVANRHSDNIVVLKRNQQTGQLTPTGTELSISQPVCLKMIPVE